MPVTFWSNPSFISRDKRSLVHYCFVACIDRPPKLLLRAMSFDSLSDYSRD